MSKAEFLNHVGEMMDMPEGSLQGSEKLADLEGWTSVAMMSFVAFADQEFGKQVSPRFFITAETVDDLSRAVGIN
jgi:acyl carrier protein